MKNNDNIFDTEKNMQRRSTCSDKVFDTKKHAMVECMHIAGNEALAVWKTCSDEVRAVMKYLMHANKGNILDVYTNNDNRCKKCLR